MEIKKIIKILLLIFYFLTSSCQKSEFEKVYNPSIEAQDFTGWTSVGSGASWSVSTDGKDASQSYHSFSNPVFLISNTSYSEVLIEGSFLALGDDDNIGVVFGHLSPLNSSETAYDFYLYDWRRADQTISGDTGLEGHALSKVNGTFSSSEMMNHFFARTDTGSSGKFDVLETRYGSGKGWSLNSTHTFKIYYTSNRIKVIIDGSTIFDVSGSYQAGHVGLYLYSQNNVTFSYLTLTTGFDPNSF